MTERQIEQMMQVKIEQWFDFVLFSPLWWLGVILSVVPWFLWFLFRNKQSTDRLLYAGLFVMTVSLVFDVTGDQLGLWNYRYNVVPFLPTYLPWDLTLVPLAILLLLQVKPQANPYLKAILFALLTSYVGEPIFTFLSIYDPVNWRLTFSVPIYFLIYLGAHFLTRRDSFRKLA